MKHWLKRVGLGVAVAIVAVNIAGVNGIGEKGAKGNSTEGNSHWFGLVRSVLPSGIAQSAESGYIRPRVTCPDQLESLVALLLRDLPGYANRVSQRSYIENFRITDSIPGTIILAGQPEFQPIELVSREYTSMQPDDTTQQVFFTTLERQYTSKTIVDLQHYYWLFLTQTQDGWRMVLLFSSLGPTASNEPPTPPQDASQGVVAQAIRLWLRDCRAGSIQVP